MECEEVQICDICGDAGFDDELAICGRCNDSAEHIYCMTTMLESVPLQWVCERCEMEEKGSAKKRLACSEPLPIGAARKHTTNDQSSCYLEMNEAKDVVKVPKSFPQSVLNIPGNFLNQSDEPELRAPSSPRTANKGLPKSHNIPNAKEESALSPKDLPAVKACLLQPRLEGAPVKAAGLAACTLSCLHKSAVACEVSLKANVIIAEKDPSNLSKSFADRPLSGSKRVFSRSPTFPVGDDQLKFLLPSRPKDLPRSKSAVVRPSVTRTSCSNMTSSFRNETSTSVKKERFNVELTHAADESATRGASHMMESCKSTWATEPKTHRQAGECKNKNYNWSSRDPESLRFHARSSDYGKETNFRHLKESRRCYNCDEVGHVAAQCKSSSSSSPRVGEVRRAAASSDKSKLAKYSIPEIPSSMQSRKEINSPKKSSQWKPQESGTSFKPACNEPQIRGKEGLLMLGTMDISPQPSPKLGESRVIHEEQITKKVQSPKGGIGTHGPLRGGVALQQAQGVSAKTNKQSQGLSNLVFPSKPHNDGGIGEVASREAGLAVDTFSESHCEIVAEPCVQILWRYYFSSWSHVRQKFLAVVYAHFSAICSGCFHVSSMCLTAYNGMQAHASTKADPRVSEAMKSLPFELHLEELKRGVETDTWPRSLQNRPPTSSSIGVYFFPVDMECHDTWYKPLLDHLAANDLALRTSMDFFQLLIFPSQLLPEADQRWDDRQYLWGILRSATVKSSLTAALGETA